MPKITEEDLNKLQSQIDKLKKDIEEYETRIQEKDIELVKKSDKIKDLNVAINELKLKLSYTEGELKKVRAELELKTQRLEELEKTNNKLKEQNEGLIEKLNSLSDSYRELSDAFGGLKKSFEQISKDLSNRDAIINELQEKNKDLEEKYAQSMKEKEEILQEKIQKMEEFMNIKHEMTEELSKLKVEKQAAESKIKELRQVIKSRSDGLLGTIIEIDSLKKKIAEKDKELEAVSGQMKNMLEGESGFFKDLKDLVEMSKKQIQDARRYIRLVSPNVEFLEEYGIIDLLKSCSDRVMINLAIALNNSDSENAIIEKLKEDDFNVIETSERNIFGLAVDGSYLAIGVIKNENVRGLYTTIPEFINLLLTAIMTPFAKGKKL